MKKIYTSLFALLAIVSVSTAQQVVNGGFEDWGFSRINWGGCDCDTATGWYTTYPYGIEDQAIQKSDQFYDGMHSMLVRRSTFELFPVSQGIAYSAFEEDALRGYYKTDLVAGDSVSIAVRYETDRKVVARDLIYISNSTSEWTFFQFRLVNKTAADSIVIRIMPTHKDDTSKIWLDEVKLDKFVDLAETEKSEFAIFPNPAQSQMTVMLSAELGNNEQVDVVLMDMAGRTVETLFSGSTQQNAMTFDVNDVERGMYLVRVNRAGQQTVKTVMIR